ncbi:uncharacterized protein FIBRA_07079 [Fibroporia radiculosa]|uniref:Autophagy-related protein 11 n=1 Tax=Fibroporia radiculosa TaxID=599839 RepID=J4H4F1_9APHY|nr:uncharacterized protein FIBRA_07079 [Fibroporia radiculosa]CCM04884.1 predicted protein [Fibroporia radiculosa]
MLETKIYLRLGNIESFLEDKTGVLQDHILAYLSDGRRLRDDNIRELASVQDQTIFVFNKRYLDLDVNQVLSDLQIEPALQPPVEDTIASTPPFRITQLATSYVHVAHAHNEHVKQTLLSLSFQNAALNIASSALDLHVLEITSVFDGIAEAVRRELDKQSALLDGLDGDLAIVERVSVHKEFLSDKVRRAIDDGDRGRTLGDYVSRDKMRMVANNCKRAHEELRALFREVQETMLRLSGGAEEIRTAVVDQSLLGEAEACVKRSQEAFDKATELSAVVEKPVSAPDKVLSEFRQLDNTLRSELQYITQVKNSYTEHCITTLRRVSILNNDLVELPTLMASLQAALKARTSFSHIQRLHNMLYAYGATVVEVVRRKEFSRFFIQRSQSILEVMAKLSANATIRSANERKRRQVYRGEVHGLLPFETTMDDPVPAIDFSPSGTDESAYSLERPDVDGLLQLLDDLEHFAEVSQDPAALKSVAEARAGLERLVGKMDSLETAFDRIAERSLLSASRLTSQRRRTAEEDLELELEIQKLRHAQTERDTVYQMERQALEEQAVQLRDSLDAERAARDELERELRSVRAQLESESTSRRILEERNTQLCSGADGHREALARALAEATEQTRAAEIVRQELAQVRAEFKHIKAIEKHNTDKVASLLEEQAHTLTRLEEARVRGEDLESQIQAARSDGEEVKRALVEADREKDRLLRAQASEHDRMMRDHIAEADGDRAVLEHQFSELKAALEDTERQLKDARAQTDMALADTVGLREELQRVEHQLREAQHMERVLRDDLRDGRASQSDFEMHLENSGRLMAQILDVALAFRDSHVKALVAAQAMASHPAANRASTNLNLTDSAISPGRLSIVSNNFEPPPIDPSDPAAALEALRAFDHDHFMEAINKAGSTIRKWQKQCKEYRERAKGKISFRNFTKGDLALFLPTRNSVSKPWAAFNVSFPHYFLQATGHLAEQLKTREWIVARITSITERVVDQKDPSTNPYGLGDGVKYYMLEVEDWTQPSYASKRREPVRKASLEVKESTSLPLPSPPIQDAAALPVGPPENEVEDSFSATKPPNSRLFPVRTRSNSSPNAGPSSLSRLLAQAPPPEMSLESTGLEKPSLPSPVNSPRPPPSPAISPRPPSSPAISPRPLPSPVTFPRPPPSPITSTHPQPSPTHTGAVPQIPGPPGVSSLRPGSRSSRVSISSRFSGGRMPFGTSSAAKAVATTAISEQAVALVSPSSDLVSGRNGASQASSVPSSEDSHAEGVSSLATYRRRTTSYASPRNNATALSATLNGSSPFFGSARPSVGAGASASSRLASLASSWGVSFSRRKRSEVEENVDSSNERPATPNPISPSHVLENAGLLAQSPGSFEGQLGS